MSRFFVEHEQNNKIVIIKGEDFHHIKNVLRKRPGDTILVCDGKGFDYRTMIERIYKDCLEAVIEEKFKVLTEPNLRITLYQSMPKSDKMDWIVQKSVELGVFEIIPVYTNRTIVKYDPQSIGKKTERWQKISLEAAKQSNRGLVPRIFQPLTFDQALEQSTLSDCILIPYEEEKNHKLSDLCDKICCASNHSEQKTSSRNVCTADIESLSVFIGPEGGFEAWEIEAAKEKDAFCVSLGPRILRTETAPLSILSILMYKFGDLS